MAWATKQDLYSRYGDELMDKLAVRRDWDEYTESYVANESTTTKEEMLDIALEDAKQLIINKLSCYFSDFVNVNTYDYPVLKQWHIKTAIELLKVGGDCSACNCEKLDEFLKCNTICTADGVCLKKKSTFISATEAVFDCEDACEC